MGQGLNNEYNTYYTINILSKVKYIVSLKIAPQG